MAKPKGKAPRRRPRVGDILEISTTKGLGYAQWTHRFDDMFNRDLIRVIEGLFDKRPDDLDSLAARPTLFWAFIFVGSEWSRGFLTSLGPAAIPAHARERPTMRTSHGEGHAPLPQHCFIVDSQGVGHRIAEYPVGYWQLSQTSLRFGPGIIEDIENQVRPEDRPLREIAERQARDGNT